MLDLFYFITSGEGDLFYFLFLFLFQGRIVQCYKLLIFYSSLTIVEFTSENDCPIIIKPRKKMNYNFISTFFLFLINVCVFSFFFLKVAERYLGHVTKSPIIYIYIYIYIFFFFTINQSLLKITKLKLYNLEHPPWSHISYDQVRPQFTKPFQFVNKAPLSKLMSYLIYISPNPNETWSISFAKSSTSSSIVLRLLLMCGCSNTAICY